MEKSGSLEDFLIAKIRKSGYPLEIEISNTLDENYFVVNNAYYFDMERREHRNIDIHASPLDRREMYNEERLAPFLVRTEIAIECKKSDTHAWVFFTRPSDMLEMTLAGVELVGQFKSSVPVPPESSLEMDEFEYELERISDLHYSTFERNAISYEEIKKTKDSSQRRGSQRREIFEAVQQLVKFTSYEIHESLLRRSKLTDLNPEEELIFYLFPVLVFDGDMFEVAFDSGEPKLERRSHILLDTSYRCPYCGEVESFKIDIVHRAYFREFVKILETDFKGLRKAIVKNHHKLLVKAQEARARKKTKTES